MSDKKDTGDKDGNGRLTPMEEAIQAEKTCVRCKSRFPDHVPIMLPFPAPKSVITQPGAAGSMHALMVHLCIHGKSPHFQTLVSNQCSCEEFKAEPKKIKPPLKIADRMGK